MTDTTTETVTAFKFDDLSEKAKQHAMDMYAVDDVYYEGLYEQYKEDGYVRGFHIDSFNFSGFASQGDGASWIGYIDIAEFLAYHLKPDNPAYTTYLVLLELLRNGYVDSRGYVNRVGYYVHSHTMYVEGTGYNDPINDDEVLTEGVMAGANAQELIEAIGDVMLLDSLGRWMISEARAYADELYAALETEYDAYFNETAFRELADLNEWVFDETGRITS